MDGDQRVEMPPDNTPHDVIRAVDLLENNGYVVILPPSVRSTPLPREAPSRSPRPLTNETFSRVRRVRYRRRWSCRRGSTSWGNRAARSPASKYNRPVTVLR